jgi:uncharacterized GH25 family protein
MKNNIIFFITFLCLPVLSQAHYLWIESDNDTEAKVYFGEFNEGVIEVAGGRLDERDNLKAYIQSAKENMKPLEFVKRDNHFSTALKNANGWIYAEDLTNEVKDWSKYDIGVVKPMFYARAAAANKPQPAKTALTLDIIPVSVDDQQTYQVFFKDKPLAGAKLKVYAPNMWMQEIKTDDNGKLSITTPWTGRYVLDIIYLEPSAGEFEGKKYDKIRHRSTYSFVR